MMEGRNRANHLDRLFRLISEEKEKDVPCVFISYQRKDEEFATAVADYIKEHQIDVFFDLDDINLKKGKSPELVTNLIKAGLNKSNFMLVIVSPTTYESPWVPFEIGYAYDNMGAKMKILKHRDLPSQGLPDYLKTKEFLHGFQSLNSFLSIFRSQFNIYESIIKKGHSVKTFSSYSNPLQKYLVNA
jgi:hypothetical protein